VQFKERRYVEAVWTVNEATAQVAPRDIKQPTSKPNLAMIFIGSSFVFLSD
jgi:hypothetical protein